MLRAASSLAALALLLLPTSALAQDAVVPARETTAAQAREQDPPPERQAQQPVPLEDQPIRSMGFPPRWKPYVGFTIDWDRRGPEAVVAGQLALGVYRDIAGPVTGVLGYTVEGYLRPNENNLDGGGRLFASFETLHLHLGADYSARDNRVDFIASLAWPWRRGGILGGGSGVRIDWVPARNHMLSIGFQIRLGQPWMGKTRPKKTSVRVPKASGRWRDEGYRPGQALQQALAAIDHGADWINRYTTPFFDLSRDVDQEGLDEFSAKIQQFKDHIALIDDSFPRGHTFREEIAAYHLALERAFGIAVGAQGNDDLALIVADRAREILLDRVILRYDRLLGQRKTPDTLLGWGEEAETEFEQWLVQESDVPAFGAPAARYVMRQLVEEFDKHRQGAREHWGDDRYVWLPLHWVLRPEQVDDREELDALVERLTLQRFSEGNDSAYVINEQFQLELRRTIRAAEDYHVLWVHDFRGYNNAMEPDSLAFMITKTYLEQLIESVRNYDTSGRLVEYFILQDQHYFEIWSSRLWLELLADPLRHRLELPDGYAGWSAEIEDLQRQLRDAVADSRQLQSNARRFGDKWLRNRVRVHVNITLPADFSFRSPHIIEGIPFMPDTMMRDHRKIVFYDVTEEDPNKGEAIYTGVGVGEHYAGQTWEDRSILVDGPAIVHLKHEAHDLLISQGFKSSEIPYPLRPQQRPANYDQMVAERAAGLKFERGMELHNENGFGQKDANLIKGVLYTMMPTGSHMYLPDSLWNSPLWAGMIVGASLRGCTVLPIAPSKENSPGQSAFTLSRANEIFTRFVLLQDLLGDEIQASGGLLQAGIYDLDVDASDIGAVIHYAGAKVEESTFIRDLLPFADSARDSLIAVPDRLVAEGIERVPLVEEVEERKPKLHLKTQLFLSPEIIETLVPRPEWGTLMQNWAVERARQTQIGREFVPARELSERLTADALAMVTDWYDGLSREQQQRASMYFTVGSHNQDYRSTMMDGEVLYVLTGLGAMTPFPDFVFILASTTWIDDVDQLRELLPEYDGIWAQLARWIKNAL